MVDANIIIYALSPTARHHLICKSFLDRGISKDINLHVTVQIAADVIHRVMAIEAAELLSNAQPITYLFLFSA